MSGCRNPDCENYEEGVNHYCCTGCAEHHYDMRNSLGEFEETKYVEVTEKGVEIIDHREEKNDD